MTDATIGICYFVGMFISEAVILEWIIPEGIEHYPSLGKTLLAAFVWPISMPYLVYLRIKSPRGVIL